MKTKKKLIWTFVVIVCEYLVSHFLEKLVNIKTNPAIVNQLNSRDSAYLTMEAARSLNSQLDTILFIVTFLILILIWTRKEI